MSNTVPTASGSETHPTLNQRQHPSREAGLRGAYAGNEPIARSLSGGSINADGDESHDASASTDEKAPKAGIVEGDDGLRDSSTITAEESDSRGEVQEKGSDATVVTYPEGGLRAWLVVMGAFWCTFFTWGFVNA